MCSVCGQHFGTYCICIVMLQPIYVECISPSLTIRWVHFHFKVGGGIFIFIPTKKTLIHARPIWVKYVQLSLSIISFTIHPYVCMPAAKALIRLHRGLCAGSSEPWLPTHAISTKILVRPPTYMNFDIYNTHYE